MIDTVFFMPCLIAALTSLKLFLHCVMYQLNFLYERLFVIDVTMSIDSDILLKYDVQWWSWEEPKTCLKWWLGICGRIIFLVVCNCSSHNLGCLLQYTLRRWMIVMLTTSVCPSVCGWKAVLFFNFVSIMSHNFDQKFPTNRESRSLTIEVGRPKWTHTFWKKWLTVYSTVIFFLHGIKRQFFLNLSTTTYK